MNPINAATPSSAAGRRYSFVTVLTFAITLFTAAKLVGLTIASPLIAFPDNWDFARVESCMGLWADYGDPTVQAHLSGPMNNLVLTRKVQSDACAASVDTLFPYVVTRFFDTGEKVDFRYIGMLRVAATLCMLIWSMFLTRNAISRLVIAFVFALLFGEFGYATYANTLYNEYSVLLGVYGSVIALYLAWTDTSPSRKNLWSFLATSVAILGLSKPQYAPLAPLVAATGAAILWRRGIDWGKACVLILIGIAAPVVFALLNPSDSGFGRRLKLVNITNTIFTEVLPHATDSTRAIRNLGLPQACSVMIGRSFYSPGVDAHHPCPEVINVSRATLPLLFITQPSIFIHSMGDGLSKLRPFPGVRYGFFEEPSLENSHRVRITIATSMGTYLNGLPKPAFRFLVITSMLSAIPLCLWCALWNTRNRARRYGIDLLLAIGATIVVYSVASSVFGDGSSEVAKHAFLWVFGIGLQALAIAGWLTLRYVVDRGEPPQTTP